LIEIPNAAPKPRLCAVSYLNTAPLVWGALHGPQREQVELTFAVPSICAQRVVAGEADLGLVPVIEMDRNGLGRVPGIGIACRGVVRSILLISKVPYGEIRTLAVDAGSRTSVQLARIVLAERYRNRPALEVMQPDLAPMLAHHDAALLIGDAALKIDPARVQYPCLDLGEAWAELTGLPMVFATWAGTVTPAVTRLLHDSLAYGEASMDVIIQEEAERRGFPLELVRRYFTSEIVFHLGPEEEAGLRRYLESARRI
jgi:predicted solute-binding protein